MNILIIGGLGFIGTNLALRLINRGYNVTVLDNFSKCNVENYEELKGKCNIIIGSIYSEMTLNKYLDGIDVVYDLASPQMLDCEKDQLECYKTNILGYQYLLDNISDYSVKKIIFSSTSSVYRGSGNMFNEKSQAYAANKYTLSKIIAEQMLINKSDDSGIDYCIFRNAPVYGPRQFKGGNGSGITIKIIKSLYTNNLLELYSGGKSKKEFLYIDDLIYYYEQAIFKGHGTYNLSTNKSIEIKKVFELLRNLTKRKGNIIYSEKGERYDRSFDNCKLFEVFGRIEFTSLEDGLINTLKWYEGDV